MASIRVSVHEPEMDMRRPSAYGEGGSSKVRRLLSSILGMHQGTYKIGTPRRSIDRELQQYSPTYEW
jgi:hypothetical protein